MEKYGIQYITRLGGKRSPHQAPRENDSAVSVNDVCQREGCGASLSGQRRIMLIVCSAPGEMDTCKPICHVCEGVMKERVNQLNGARRGKEAATPPKEVQRPTPKALTEAKEAQKTRAGWKGTCKCMSCGEPSLFTCTQCKAAYYCGRECQRSDWAIHKPECSCSCGNG
jgi:hypothetical protein